ncbi:MAG: M20/M25/M40 family metallo-hydrolase, partial [Hyphomonadaceae bacterium]|nr:M20/M25/M40 family metallo-hydrolase [Hyphomonadaceae bacterium]
MRFRTVAASLAFITAITPTASSQQPDAGRAAFRAIYEEMVEIDSSPTTGSCTKVVQVAQARLKAAGYADADLQLIVPPGKPDDGNLVATLRAPGAKKKGVLLMGHIDVVDAKRADWERDPFTLFEENGYVYGRGTADMKGQAAVWLDMMIRLKQERTFKPSRDIVMALTCGEETSNRVNGIDYILTNHRNL